jgi:hypothetical protein
LRSESGPEGKRFLAARLDEGGALVIEGEDLVGRVDVLGVGVSSYEWARTVRAADVPRLAAHLGVLPGEDVLERDVSGPGAAGLDAAREASGVPFERWSWIG